MGGCCTLRLGERRRRLPAGPCTPVVTLRPQGSPVSAGCSPVSAGELGAVDPCRLAVTHKRILDDVMPGVAAARPQRDDNG